MCTLLRRSKKIQIFILRVFIHPRIIFSPQHCFLYSPQQRNFIRSLFFHREFKLSVMENRGIFNRLISYFHPNPKPSPLEASKINVMKSKCDSSPPNVIEHYFEPLPPFPTSIASIKEEIRLKKILEQSKAEFKQSGNAIQLGVFPSEKPLKVLKSSACPKDRAKAVELEECLKQMELESNMQFDRRRVVPQVYFNGRLSSVNKCHSKWTTQSKLKHSSSFETTFSSSSSLSSSSSSLSSSSSSSSSSPSSVFSNLGFQTNVGQSKSNGCDSQATSRTKTLSKPASSTLIEKKNENEDKGKEKEKLKDVNKSGKTEKNGNENLNKNEKDKKDENNNTTQKQKQNQNENVCENASSSIEESNKDVLPRRYTYAEKGKAIAVYPPFPPIVKLKEIAKSRNGITIGKDRPPIHQSQPSTVEDKPNPKVRDSSTKNVSPGSGKEVSSKDDKPIPISIDEVTFKRIVRDFALAFQIPTANKPNASNDSPSNQTTVIVPPTQNKNKNKIENQNQSNSSASSSLSKRVPSPSKDISYNNDDLNSNNKFKTSASNANTTPAIPTVVSNPHSQASKPKPVSQAAGKIKRWKVVPHPPLKKNSPSPLPSPTPVKRPIALSSLPSPNPDSNEPFKRCKPYAPPQSSPPSPLPPSFFSSLASQNNSPVKRPVRIKTPIDWAAFSAKWSESFHKMNLAKSNLDARKSTLTQAQQAVVDSICAQTGLGLDRLDRAAVCSYVNEMTKTVLESTDAAHADWIVAETEAVAYFKMLYKKKLLGYYSQRRWSKYAEHKKGFTQYLPQVCEGNEEEEQDGEGSGR